MKTVLVLVAMFAFAAHADDVTLLCDTNRSTSVSFAIDPGHVTKPIFLTVDNSAQVTKPVPGGYSLVGCEQADTRRHTLSPNAFTIQLSQVLALCQRLEGTSVDWSTRRDPTSANMAPRRVDRIGWRNIGSPTQYLQCAGLGGGVMIIWPVPAGLEI